MVNRSRQAIARSDPSPFEVEAYRLLLVDRDPSAVKLLENCRVAGRHLRVSHAPSLHAARKLLSNTAIDLALIHHQLSDGDGLDLIRFIAGQHTSTQVLMLSDEPRYDLATAAVRAGAVDMLVKPLTTEEVAQRLGAAAQRLDKQRNTVRRLQRLRRLCKKLDQARKDVAGQVDVLCNDLVVAYQELATQMQQVVQTSEFNVLVREELDLEMLIRKTLEYVIEQAGATNAAVFLPSGMDEFTLGGYVNYDCSTDGTDLLLEHLADTVAPRIADQQQVIHLTTNAQIEHWVGADAAYLADAHVIAFSVIQKDEVLAVIVLFRDSCEPFSETLLETAGAIRPLLGEALARIIRVHHRSLGEVEPDDGFEVAGPDDVPF
ncbi:MAG: response regulator [Phycisphaeraceae bacterium]|nr:response regulator [Phycisphaeraceae bacterium]